MENFKEWLVEEGFLSKSLGSLAMLGALSGTPAQAGDVKGPTNKEFFTKRENKGNYVPATVTLDKGTDAARAQEFITLLAKSWVDRQDELKRICSSGHCQVTIFYKDGITPVPINSQHVNLIRLANNNPDHKRVQLLLGKILPLVAKSMKRWEKPTADGGTQIEVLFRVDSISNQLRRVDPRGIINAEKE